MRGLSKRFDSASLKGERPRQEDRYGRFAGDGLELFAIADGFSKEPDDVERTGARVSGMVIASALELAPVLVDGRDISASLLSLFGEIDMRTKDELSGSTLALAVLDNRSNSIHAAALGDTMLVYSSLEEGLSYVPYEHRLELGSGLWGCFGDSVNRRWHSQTPEMASFAPVPGSVLLIGCDGLFASNDFDAIAERSAELISFIRDGASAEDLAAHALREYGSTDNVTAMFMAFE